MKGYSIATCVETICLIFFLINLCGCAAAVVSGAGAAATYSFTNVAYRTFSYSIEDVEQATVGALDKMAIDITEMARRSNGRKFTGLTPRLTINIDLEVITKNTTKMKVDARKGRFLKDKATAGEIIWQVARILEKEV